MDSLYKVGDYVKLTGKRWKDLYGVTNIIVRVTNIDDYSFLFPMYEFDSSNTYWVSEERSRGIVNYYSGYETELAKFAQTPLWKALNG